MSDVGRAAAKLLEAGLTFLASLAPAHTAISTSTDLSAPVERALSALLQTDFQTQRQVFTIPLPESFGGQRLAGIIGGLLSKFAGVS